MTLGEFLLARITEGEAQARMAQERAALDPECGDSKGWWAAQSDASGDWIVAMGSERALAECEAKRRIVGHESYDRPKLGAPPYNGPLNDPDNPGQRHPQLVAYIASHGERVVDTAILRCLALPYADHPDYREEWRP